MILTTALAMVRLTMTRYPSKRCGKCGKRKSLRSGFYRSDWGTCKECVKTRMRAHYHANYETKIRTYEAARFQTPKRKAKLIEYQRARRARDPLKYRARNAVSNALRDGRLHRRPCRCGAKRVQAHHHDYSKPLDVEWLCFRCHRKDEHHQKNVRSYAERGPALRRKP